MPEARPPLPCEQGTSAPAPCSPAVPDPARPGGGMAQTQRPAGLGLASCQPPSARGPVEHKQSLNRNVTEEIIAISNDNTQF